MENPQLTIRFSYIDKDTGKRTPFRKILEFHIHIDQLHRELGGAGLFINETRAYHEIEEESPYDLFKGTPFETIETRFEEDMRGAPNYSRSEVYKALFSVCRTPCEGLALARDLRRDYPRKTWFSVFPPECINKITRQHSRMKSLLSEDEVTSARKWRKDNLQI